MGLRIYDTRRREKVPFEPIDEGKVGMYVCGITSYAPCHIGHGRMYLAFDVIYRWLKRSYDVTYVRNFTDVDDKIIKAATAAGEDPAVLAQRYIDLCELELGKIGCAQPTESPRVTQNIPQIIALIETIIANGHGYAVDGDVYFDVKSFDAYGTLSGRTLADLDDLEAGARVDVDTRKRSPHDFALWKSAKPGEPFWASPWGDGRPGWHIECSAMSSRYLGETFDIHGGGKDLVFPHHENEIAQSCAASKRPELARYWLHNGFVNLMPEICPSCAAEVEAVECGQGLPDKCGCGYEFTEMDSKMSKSRGNFYPLGEIIAAYEPEALRALLLSCQYRTPISFSHKLLVEAERRLDKVYETLAAIDAYVSDQTFSPGDSFAKMFEIDLRAKFEEAMDDDFNTAKALADVGEVFRIANDLVNNKEKARIGRKISATDKSRLLTEVRQLANECGDVLGLWAQDPQVYLTRRRTKLLAGLDITEEQIEQGIVDRATARSDKDWARADEIRNELKAKGVVLNDSPTGTTWAIDDA